MQLLLSYTFNLAFLMPIQLIYKRNLLACSYVSFVSPFFAHFSVPLSTSYMLPLSKVTLLICCRPVECVLTRQAPLAPRQSFLNMPIANPNGKESLRQLSAFAVLLSIRCLLKIQICHHKNDIVNNLCYLVQSCSPAFNFVLLVIL